jgi:hypothetical protein
MQDVPSFRTEADAARYAEIHRPFHRALKPNDAAYEVRWGSRVARAAESCRQAAIAGDTKSLHLRSIGLSITMQAVHPHLFVSKAERKMAA